MRHLYSLATLLAACITLPAAAQVAPPFFQPGVSAFSPEISVVNSGILHDVQATVSADRKYVTLGMRPQNAQLIALFEFSLATGTTQPSFVGNVQLNATTAGLGILNATFTLTPGTGASLLQQRGMTPIASR